MTCPSLIEGTSFTFKNGRTFTVMLSFNEGLRILINKVSFLLLKKTPSVLTLYSGNILKCPPEQSWKCSLALIIVRSWCLFVVCEQSFESAIRYSYNDFKDFY
jgi:hypothetical protein